MERRILLAFALSFVVVFGFQFLLGPEPPQGTTASAPGPSALKAGGGQQLSPAGGASAPFSPVEEAAERLVVVETNDVIATFTSRGARLRHWVLKRYVTEGGQPVDLVPADLPAGTSLPLSLSTTDGNETRRFNSAVYKVSASSDRIDGTADAVTLVFELESGDGLSVKKVVQLQPRGYRFELTTTVRAGGRDVMPTVEWGPGLGDQLAAVPPSGFFGGGSYQYPPEGFVSASGSVERFAASSLESGQRQEGQFEFAGVNDHYFVSSVVKPVGSLRVDFSRLVVADTQVQGAVRTLVSYSVRPSSAGATLGFFAGPKQFDLLQAVDPGFTRVINFGMFAWLAVPLLGALKWVNGFVGNFGWSIVILTVVINLTMWPLKHRSMVSMRRMQEIQPQLKAIQDRYAGLKITDPARQKMNEEVAALYREKQVNPAGGCLPMLLTMPVLFAFYSLLSEAIEIRGAHFAGWITDLSQYDPYFVTPLLMGVTMFWQQKLTPTTADPVQQRVMMFMPVMFTVMFLWAPSGLVIYWFVSNIWAVGQQYVTNAILGPPAAAGTPSVGAGAKRVGSGRTSEAAKR